MIFSKTLNILLHIRLVIETLNLIKKKSNFNLWVERQFLENNVKMSSRIHCHRSWVVDSNEFWEWGSYHRAHFVTWGLLWVPTLKYRDQGDGIVYSHRNLEQFMPTLMSTYGCGQCERGKKFRKVIQNLSTMRCLLFGLYTLSPNARLTQDKRMRTPMTTIS